MADTGIDWLLMRETDPDLYAEMQPYVAKNGTLKWMPNALVPRMQAWVKKYDVEPKAAEKRRQEEEKRKQEEERAEQDRKALADKQAGIARLLEWSESGGLEDTKANSNHITNWLRDNTKGYISAKNIDVAISILGPKGKSVLTWHKPKSTPPLPKTEPTELLGNGEVRLPLGTTPSSRHSITQLRDLDARERAAKGRGGWHGAKF
jgi:hypothetical protein